MQITVSDIDNLNPPAEVADLVRRADKEGHVLWGGGQPTQGTAHLHGVRIDGPGWDIVIMWTAPQEGAPYLSSLLARQEPTGEWDVVSIAKAQTRISGQA